MKLHYSRKSSEAEGGGEAEAGNLNIKWLFAHSGGSLIFKWPTRKYSKFYRGKRD